MANPTTNFGWVMPTSASLVTNLPADFNTFGQGVDTSMQYLKGGTTGQILSKTSATDMAFTWITNDVGDITAVTAGTGISGGGTSGTVTITNSMATEITAKGDLIVGTGSATFDNLPVGANNTTLVADSSTATGLKWAAASSGALTLIKRASFSSVATTGTTFDTVFTSTYRSFMVVIEQISAATEGDDLHLLFRYGGTSQILTYFSSSIQLPASGTIVNTVVSNGAQATLAADTGGSAYPSGATMYFSNIGNGSSKPYVYGQMASAAASPSIYNFSGYQDTSRSYDGFLLKSSSTNITGTISVYGLAIA